MSAENILKAIAIGYVFLGGFYWSGKASLDSQTIAALSITAAAFILSDAIKIYSGKYASDHVIFKGFQHLAAFFNTIGFVIAIAGPYLLLKKLDYEDETYGVISTGVSLIGLGFSIYIMAKRSGGGREV